ncbi:MAG: hypothetical protein WCO08_00735 [Actinomycetes bacterium]
MISRNKNLWFVLLSIATAWNIVLSIFAIANSHWVLTHVAGGQFHSLPATMRGYYVILLIASIVEIWFANKLRLAKGPWSMRTARICTSLTLAYGLSTLVNAASRSPQERYNAPFALIVAYGFFVLGRVEAEKKPAKGGRKITKK